jgi:hypothetical protein
MSVQRTAVVHTSILAPSETVVAFLSDLENWKTWAPPGVSTREFERDIRAVTDDLARLKKAAEALPKAMV